VTFGGCRLWLGLRHMGGGADLMLIATVGKPLRRRGVTLTSSAAAIQTVFKPSTNPSFSTFTHFRGGGCA
jgi:hypothetical protein